MTYQKEIKSTRKVLVIGDMMLDQYVIGQARRLCPEAPVPIIEGVETLSFPEELLVLQLISRAWEDR